jgi:HNH endonuclease
MDIEQLRDLVSYNPESGELKRKDRVRGRKPGAKPTHTIMVGNKIFARSRLAWALATGEFPKGKIYVVDGNRLNFALSNLSRLKPRGVAPTKKELFEPFAPLRISGTPEN